MLMTKHADTEGGSHTLESMDLHAFRYNNRLI